MQDTVGCDLSLNSVKADKNIVIDTKPDIKGLFNRISNFDTVNSNISQFAKCDLNDMEHTRNMSINMDQDNNKQESTSHSVSACRVKDEIMYCQSCLYSDIDLNRLKIHIFREHPAGTAVVSNSFDKADCCPYGINLFCVKDSCGFSSTQCNVYEEHLMSCCLLHENLSEDEKDRLNSTVKFILDFENKHSLNAVPGFLNYFYSFNTFTCKDDKVQLDCTDLEKRSSSRLSGPVLDDSVSCAKFGTKYEGSLSLFPTPVPLLTTQSADFNQTVCKTENTSLSVEEQERKHELSSKSNPCNATFASSEGETAVIQSSDDNDVSENIALEIDVAGSPIDINSFKEETKEDNIKEEKMFYGDCCTKDLQVSSQQSEYETRMTSETQPVDHTRALYNDAMRVDRGHFNNDMTSDSNGLHSDMKVESGKKSLHINESAEVCGYNRDFIKHKKSDTKEKPLIFNVCSKNFVPDSTVFRSRKRHTEEKPFKCIDCGKTFGRNSHLIVHMRTHTGEKPFKCTECGKTFGHNSSLIKHRITHTGEQPFKCNECGKTFGFYSSLIKHRKIHTGEKPFKCNECGKRFSQNSPLIVHRRTHTGEKPFKCNDCGKTFGQNNHLSEHKRTHTGEKPFKCNECGKSFSLKSPFVVHKRKHTGKQPFKCNDCGKTFTQNSHLIVHLRTHTGEKEFKCNDCGKTFSQKGHLIVHRRTHTGEKPFKCYECGKNFSQNSHLIVHMRTHTRAKAFQCNECGMTFGHNSSLIGHRRTHTGGKPFKCNECGKTFSRNYHLIEHVKTHTGQKPFGCFDCGKRFSRSSHLIRHRITHSGEKPHKCSDCGKAFSQRSHLTGHRKIHK